MQQHFFQVYSNAPDCTRIRHFNAPNSKFFWGGGPAGGEGDTPSPHPIPLGASSSAVPPRWKFLDPPLNTIKWHC